MFLLRIWEVVSFSHSWKETAKFMHLYAVYLVLDKYINILNMVSVLITI